ncbi:hypothetical protein [Planomicrobium sp. Y74]|uniref:hypothetical protein n=1 Tax=Planomicrobium sp. Y74 TaxID=2478977 RepID=UPI000EF4B73B|nr:hypothetical protein [Planomicrobium sp. Y74]RLQ92110.1 hypothetical protein D9754_04820 [Planomicrobium sp. Y74]
MKILIICESCNQIGEFKSANDMYNVSVRSATDKFLAGLDWDIEIVDNINEDFLTDLTDSSSIEKTIEILVNDITKNIYAVTSEFEICFTCMSCGDQIIMNDFKLN